MLHTPTDKNVIRNITPAGAKSITRNEDGQLVIEWHEPNKEALTISRDEYIATFVKPVMDAKRAENAAKNEALAKDEEAREQYRAKKKQEAEAKCKAIADRVAKKQGRTHR